MLQSNLFSQDPLPTLNRDYLKDDSGRMIKDMARRRDKRNDMMVFQVQSASLYKNRDEERIRVQFPLLANDQNTM